MLRTIAVKNGALGILLLGAVVGLASAQVVDTYQRQGSLSTGLFTLAAGEVLNFNVTLDDDSSGPVGKVYMRLIDDRGTVKASKLVSLGPGQSATLPYSVPGRYRAVFELRESTLNLSDRRAVASTVEVFDVNDFKINRFVCGENIPPRKV